MISFDIFVGIVVLVIALLAMESANRNGQRKDKK